MKKNRLLNKLVYCMMACSFVTTLWAADLKSEKIVIEKRVIHPSKKVEREMMGKETIICYYK